MIKKTITGKELIYKHQKENKAQGGSLRHPVQRRRPRKAEPLTKPRWLHPVRKLQGQMLDFNKGFRGRVHYVQRNGR